MAQRPTQRTPKKPHSPASGRQPASPVDRERRRSLSLSLSPRSPSPKNKPVIPRARPNQARDRTTVTPPSRSPSPPAPTPKSPLKRATPTGRTSAKPAPRVIHRAPISPRSPRTPRGRQGYSEIQEIQKPGVVGLHMVETDDIEQMQAYIDQVKQNDPKRRIVYEGIKNQGTEKEAITQHYISDAAGANPVYTFTPKETDLRVPNYLSPKINPSGKNNLRNGPADRTIYYTNQPFDPETFVLDSEEGREMKFWRVSPGGFPTYEKWEDLRLFNPPPQILPGSESPIKQANGQGKATSPGRKKIPYNQYVWFAPKSAKDFPGQNLHPEAGGRPKREKMTGRPVRYTHPDADGYPTIKSHTVQWKDPIPDDMVILPHPTRTKARVGTDPISGSDEEDHPSSNEGESPPPTRIGLVPRKTPQKDVTPKKPQRR